MAIDAARHDRDVERAAGNPGARPGDSPLTRAPVTTMLPVRDPDRARDYYTRVLGSEKAAWFSDLEGNILCIHQDLA